MQRHVWMCQKESFPVKCSERLSLLYFCSIWNLANGLRSKKSLIHLNPAIILSRHCEQNKAHGRNRSDTGTCDQCFCRETSCSSEVDYRTNTQTHSSVIYSSHQGCQYDDVCIHCRFKNIISVHPSVLRQSPCCAK